MMCCIPAEPSGQPWMPCLTFGRPAKVELCILIDRRFSREVPIQADYTGRSIDTIITQKVKVFWKERDGKEEVVL